METENRAKQLVESVFSNLNTFNQSYSNGVSAEQVNFGYQFATAAVNIVTRDLDKNPGDFNELEKIKNASNNYMKLTKGLNDAEFAFGVDLLKTKIAEQFPELTIERNNVKVLDNSVREIMLLGFKEGLGKSDVAEVTETISTQTKNKM